MPSVWRLANAVFVGCHLEGTWWTATINPCRLCPFAWREEARWFGGTQNRDESATVLGSSFEMGSMLTPLGVGRAHSHGWTWRVVMDEGRVAW